MIQMQSRLPVKNGNKLLYPAKITRELMLCATATTTTTISLNKMISALN